ncbi:MAG: thiamine pyrophosphate-dependent enzyme, partial [Vicinamibacteraceae bacterium]
AIARIKDAIAHTYAKRGADVVQRNFDAVDDTLAHLHAVPLPATVTTDRARPPVVSTDAPDFVKRVTAMMIAGKGDLLPVSAFPVDGTWPTATSQWEKRAIATEIPVWDAGLCIQCNKCAFVCPHAAIRAKVYPASAQAGAPAGFVSLPFKGKDYGDDATYTLQVAPEDCTGCSLCVQVCPAKDKANPRHKALELRPQADVVAVQRDHYAFFLGLPEADRARVKPDVKNTQFLQPLFEYSGACAGCGETPYLKLLTQLFGDRLLLANATGCSSIYGGNLPTTPYAQDAAGRGPAWANSLFEDNAEFGLGMRLAVDRKEAQARDLVRQLASSIGPTLADELLASRPVTAAEIAAQRDRIAALRLALAGREDRDARRLAEAADALVPKSVWIVGGDGWAYDIGFGGLDHVFSLGLKVNVLVLDTEVYSNTGGQQSKATPIGAAAKFAVAGKATAKKDLGAMARAYGHVYVAQVAFGAKDTQTVKAFVEADAHPGTSLIVAYSPCIAHGYDLAHGLDQQKLAVDSGYWPLYRFDPQRATAGEPALVLDCAAPKVDLERFTRNETRFRLVEQQDPARARELIRQGQAAIRTRFATLEGLARPADPPAAAPAPATPAATER